MNAGFLLDLSISLPYFQSASHDVYKQIKIVKLSLLNTSTTSNILNTSSDMTLKQLSWNLSVSRGYSRSPTHDFVSLYMSTWYGMQYPIMLTSVVKLLHVYSLSMGIFMLTLVYLKCLCISAYLYVTGHNIYQKQLL